MGSQRVRHDLTTEQQCLLWRNVYLNLPPIFGWIICFAWFYIELHELSVYFED